jgi:uncharacterized membrane protein YdbT with pleckstrin-like domain
MATEREDVIKPDKKAAIIVSLSGMGIILAIIFLFIFFTGVGFLTVLKFLANMFNVNIVIIMIGIPVIICLLAFFITSIVSIKVEHAGCLLNDNSLTIYTNKMVFLTSEEEIPYDRIIKIDMESRNFISNIFNNKDLVFELNGMKYKELRLPSIKDPDMAIAKIIEKINIYRARIQGQVYEQDRINNILDTSRFIYKN